MNSVSMRGLNKSAALRKAHSLKAGASARHAAGSARNVALRASARDVQAKAGLQTIETDSGECYGMFCYNFEFDKVRERRKKLRFACGFVFSSFLLLVAVLLLSKTIFTILLQF